MFGGVVCVDVLERVGVFYVSVCVLKIKMDWLCSGLFMITMSTHDYSDKHLFMSMITRKLIYS